MPSVVVTGDKSIDRKLAKLAGKEANKLARAAARKAMTSHMLPAVVGNAPRGETGNLKRGIKVRAGKAKRGRIVILVTTGTQTTKKELAGPGVADPFYTAFDEYGTDLIPPQGFFRRGFDQAEAPTRADFTAQLAAALNTLAKG